jgi:glycosyltransferase involved in cell wall biosynthesis
MKILMIHVGNEIKAPINFPEDFYLYRKRLLDGEIVPFLKHDIVNADSQMYSLMEQGVEIEYGHFSNRKSVIAILKAGWKINKLSKRNEIDLVHAFWGSTTGLITCFFSRKPVIISFCGSDLMGNKNQNGRLTISGRLNRVISQFASRLTAINIIKSEPMREILPAKVRNKTYVIPNGVDLSRFYPMKQQDAAKAIGWTLDKKRILFFYTEGQLVKNLQMAEDVYQLVKQKESNVELIIGTKIPHEQLIWYYNACDVMILTSFHEGSNNSIKEARACNLPIVSVDVGDVHERIDKVRNSYIINDYSASEMADRVVEILKLGLRSNGKEYSSDVCIEGVAKQVVTLYKKIIKIA